MAKPIRSLNIGDKVLMKFHGNKQFGNAPYEMEVECLTFNENKTIATFRMDDTARTEFEAYQLPSRGWGRFSYSAEPEKISLLG